MGSARTWPAPQARSVRSHRSLTISLALPYFSGQEYACCQAVAGFTRGDERTGREDGRSWPDGRGGYHPGRAEAWPEVAADTARAG